MSTNFLDNEGLKVVATNINSRLKMLTTMPESAKDGLVRLFTGETAGKYIKGHVYQAKTTDGATTWLDITPVPETPLSVHGTIEFKNLPALKDVEPGWMYNISDDFKTTSDFVSVGAVEKAGSNVYCIEVDGAKKWDVFAVFVTDQIYDKSSTNAQSGTAVAQAAAAVAAKAKEDNNKKLDKSYTMPEYPADGFMTAYVGENTDDFKKGHLYEANVKDIKISGKAVDEVVTNAKSYFGGYYIWTDGDNIYHNNTNNGIDYSYVLDKNAGTWTSKTWEGLSKFYGSSVWTDGDNIYYSYGSNAQYVLDKSTDTWTTKTWNGLVIGRGEYIWTDGDNIYYSDGGYASGQYVLNGDTWERKTWNNMPPNFDARCVWTDGKNTYCSYKQNGGGNYVLNKATSTWEEKTWTGLTSFNGSSVWTDGNNTYLSYNISNTNTANIKHYILIKDQWKELELISNVYYSNFDGVNIWTDGKNIYHSSYNSHYTITPEVEWSDLTSSSDSTEAISTTDVTALLD